MTIATAEFILNNSSILVKENCLIFDGKLYERLTDMHLNEFFGGDCDIYRIFLDVDHYDYVEDPALISDLSQLFKPY